MRNCKRVEEDSTHNISPKSNDEIVVSMSKLYKVLGEKNRMGILYMLNEKDMCVHELISFLKVEQSLVSHQLKILRDARIVKTTRRGNEIVYSLADDHIKTLIAVAKEHVEE